MNTLPTIISATALAEDIRLIRRGGGPLTDDDNLSERQVIFWIATEARAMLAERMELSTRYGAVLPDSYWMPFTVKLTELTGGLGCWLYRGDLPGVASLGSRALVRNLFIGEKAVEQRYTPSLAPMVAGNSRFARPLRLYYASSTTLRVALPLTDCEIDKITCEIVPLPEVRYITDNPDADLPVPPDLLAELRKRVLNLLAPLASQQPDSVNNATETLQDRR